MPDLLGGDKDVHQVAGFDPAGCKGSEALASDLAHNASEDGEGGADRADTKEGEEVDAWDEDGDGDMLM